jgi:hypothetical protein
MSAAGKRQVQVPDHDLRRSARMRTFFGGKIVFNEGAYSHDCIVRDMSDSGARIEISEVRMMPRRFYFLTTMAEVAYDSELVWRTRMLAGIKFREAIDLATNNDPKLRRLKNIASELCPDSRR